jgi:hypothetical protein
VTDWNNPDSNEALKPWLLIDSLTLFQAVMLIFGRDPSYDLTGRPRGYVPIMAALKQAIERREVPALQTRDTANGGYLSLDHEDYAFVRQADVRQWLRTINRSEAFFFLDDPNTWPSASEVTAKTANHAHKTLTPRERTSLLRIIRALDVMAKLPERGATTSIDAQLQSLGFNAPKEATIRKVLDEARALDLDNKP